MGLLLASAAKRRPRPATLESAHIPAPLGGINRVDPASAMPATDAVYCWNMTAAEYGLRTRLGYKEWCTGLTGTLDNSVRTTMAFTGSRKNGTTNRVFACTSSGIWDVTSSSSSPSLLVTFDTQSGDAGFGVFTEFSTFAGRFLIYCDEENGAYVWSETGGTWTKVNAGTTQLWQPSTLYAVGNQVVNAGNVYLVVSITTGLSSSSGPTGTGAGITDGGVTWGYVSAAPSNAIGPSLADQQNGLSINPVNFAAVAVWGSRLWLIEKDSSRAWYGDVAALYGTFTSFNFGTKFRAGGPLANLFNWTYDGGSGIDTLLVAISTAGDVSIYQGTDPTSTSTFGLKGTWYVGGVPYGRKVATDYGGELLVLSLLGAVPLSKLVMGKPINNPELYETYKITNLFNLLAAQYGSLQGWSIGLHPEDNALLILVPQAPSGQAAQPLAMSMATRGWAQYRGVPMTSMCPYAGQLYFGTPDGRVCINTGYLDNVLLSNPNSFSPIEYSVLFAYQNLGNAREKQVKSIRPTLLSQTPTPLVGAWAKYGFDISEPPALTGAASGQSGTWDNTLWDSGTWGGDSTPYQPMLGAYGMGRDVAIAIRGQATSRTSLVGVDVFFEQGGLV